MLLFVILFHTLITDEMMQTYTKHVQLQQHHDKLWSSNYYFPELAPATLKGP